MLKEPAECNEAAAAATNPTNDDDTVNSTVGRRAFLKTATMVGAALCFADVHALRAAAVLAREQGKLVFTEANFNKFIADAFKKPAGTRNQMIAESKANLNAFINKYFTLTAQQKNKLSSLTSADLKAVRGAIDNAAAQNAPMKVTFNAPPTSVPRPKRMPATRLGLRRSAALKSHAPGAELDDALEMSDIGKGTTVYAMKVNTKGSISVKANGEVSGSVEISGSC
jgi:hypothetical protein